MTWDVGRPATVRRATGTARRERDRGSVVLGYTTGVMSGSSPPSHTPTPPADPTRPRERVAYVAVLVLSVTVALSVLGQTWRLPLDQAVSSTLLDLVATSAFTGVSLVASEVLGRWGQERLGIFWVRVVVGLVTLFGGGELAVQLIAWGWGDAPDALRTQVLSVGGVVLAVVLLVGLLIERSRLSVEVSRLRLQEAELILLRSRLHPHFLFNSLNAITSLIAIDPDEAERTVDDLSTLLRHVLAATDVERVPLASEIEAVRAYLSIQQRRFDERLSVALEIDDETLELPVPPLVLQPLVENAVLHGLHASERPLRVRVSCTLRPGALHVRVADDGPGTSEHVGTGTSLRDLSRRLGLLRPPGELRLEAGARGGFVALLILPRPETT